MPKSLLFLFTFFSLIYFSCKNENEKLKIEESESKNVSFLLEDNFETAPKDFWKTDMKDSSRYSIVSDPLNPNNKVLNINLKLGDVASGGRRSEIVLFTNDSISYKSFYSFRFMFPEDFFKEEDPSGMTIIHQCHDKADPGFSWATQKKSTRPPIYLFVDKNPEGENYLIFRTGLQTGQLNEVVSVKWPEQMKPNHWYTFSCEVYWHMYSNKAYVIPKLDDVYMYTKNNPVVNDSVSTDNLSLANDIENHKIYRRNMYNSSSNYLKMGIYRFAEKYDKTIYFDDFKYESERVSDCN